LAYTSEHLSLAMVEYFVQIQAADAPRDLVMLAADIPEAFPESFCPETLAD